MEILSLLYHRLRLRSASRPIVSGIYRFDINDSEPSSFIDIDLYRLSRSGNFWDRYRCRKRFQ